MSTPLPPAPPPSESPSLTAAERSPFLSFWALIPTLGFISVQCVYGWPEAKVRATGPEFAVSYLLGGVIGGLLFSILIAWVLYRITGRSRAVANVTYWVVVLFFCAAIALPALRHQGMPAASAGAGGPAVTGEFMTLSIFEGELALRVPQGTRIIKASSGDQACILRVPNSANHAEDIKIVLTFGEMPQGWTLEAGEAALTMGLKSQFHLPEDLSWRATQKGLRGGITQVVPGPEDSRPNWLVWTLLVVDDRRILSINSSIYAASETQRAADYETITRIVESIEPATTKKP